MSFVTITKPVVGAPTRKSLADTIIDDLADLNARLSGSAAGLANGSFELDVDADGIPDGWTRTLYSGGSSAISSSQRQHGAKSFSFTSTVLANGGGYAEETDFRAVAGGRNYFAEAWLWASVANVSAMAEIRWYDAAQSYLSSSTIASLTNAPTSATRYTAITVAPATARYAKLRQTGGVPGSGSATGTIYFDGIEVGLAVIQEMIPSLQIGQAQLKATYGDVGVSGATQDLTLPGGNYGFYPLVWSDNSALPGTYIICGSSGWTSPRNNINIAAGGNWSRARQYYFQASPPYDEGDGPIPLYIFALLNADASIAGLYVAPEAPYHYNGPTPVKAERYTADGRSYRQVRQLLAEYGSIKAARAAGLTLPTILDRFGTDPLVEIEITQAMKMADRAVIPHPFNSVGAGQTVVLLDPVSPLVSRLAMLHEAERELSVAELIGGGNFIIDNTALNRSAGAGVMPVAARWKLTP